MGIVEEAREKSEARRNKPQPWIVRKLAVFITIAMIAYTWYVYVGRMCVPMIRRDAGALGSRGLGSKLKFIHAAVIGTLTTFDVFASVTFLVVFCILGLMMIWAYEKVSVS